MFAVCAVTEGFTVSFPKVPLTISLANLNLFWLIFFFLKSYSFEILLKLFLCFKITDRFESVIEFFSFFWPCTLFKRLLLEHLLKGFKLRDCFVWMLDELFRIPFNLLFKEFFVLKAEGGDLDADPVAKDFEVLRVGALADEMVDGSKPQLEFFVKPLPFTVFHFRSCNKPCKCEQAEKSEHCECVHYSAFL